MHKEKRNIFIFSLVSDSVLDLGFGINVTFMTTVLQVKIILRLKVMHN